MPTIISRFSASIRQPLPTVPLIQSSNPATTRPSAGGAAETGPVRERWVHCQTQKSAGGAAQPRSAKIESFAQGTSQC